MTSIAAGRRLRSAIAVACSLCLSAPAVASTLGETTTALGTSSAASSGSGPNVAKTLSSVRAHVATAGNSGKGWKASNEDGWARAGAGAGSAWAAGGSWDKLNGGRH